MGVSVFLGLKGNFFPPLYFSRMIFIPVTDNKAGDWKSHTSYFSDYGRSFRNYVALQGPYLSKHSTLGAI